MHVHHRSESDRSVRRRWVVEATALAGAIFLPATAHASAWLEHAPSQFALEVGPPDARVCVVYPLERREAAACGELTNAPAPRLALRGGEHVLTTAVVDRGSWAYVVGVSLKEQKDVGEVSADNVDEYAAQMEASLRAGADSSVFVTIRGTQGARRGDILELNGVHALRFIVETNRFEQLDPSKGTMCSTASTSRIACTTSTSSRRAATPNRSSRRANARWRRSG